MTFRIPLLLILVSCLVVGCNGTKKKELPKVETPPLSVTIVADEPMAEAIRRELAARTEEKITVDVVTEEVLLGEKRFTKDVLIYPPAMMGELIQRDWIAPIPTATLGSEELKLDDVALGIYQTETRWGSKPYALPLGSPVLMLMVRTDLLDQLGLEVPNTWDEYAAAVETIQKSDLLKNNDTIAAATLEPLDEAYLPNLWLARSAAYVKHGENLSTYFDFATGKARIDSPGFTKAAQQLADVAQTVPDAFNSLDPKASAEAFLAGKSVMAIGWINKYTIVPETVPEDIQFAALPGSKETYKTPENQWLPRPGNQPESIPLLSTSGMVGSISSTSGQTINAANLLVLLTGPELISLISPASERTTFCRISSLPMAEAWMPSNLPGTALRQYAQANLEQLQSPRHLSALRIPNRQAYEKVIREAMQKTMAGDDANVEAIWLEAAQSWDKLSEESGQAEHIKAFRNSQGIGETAF
ncbi:Bacterial extracellular solute-binding protein [Bremerella volcania]|uniref:Bacterial extracellular solute-binding protein n=1 Tax=Bremerella volcania TaxID=2527984 RepID=A0A518CCQ3_9BACT|nr:extracellular solute-binding protein [Bremerella volcania]QDU76992.1 Bacterial extracellular solute-binding protein [Bremerella volcania]